MAGFGQPHIVCLAARDGSAKARRTYQKQTGMLAVLAAHTKERHSQDFAD
jgi:hypothetical protein